MEADPQMRDVFGDPEELGVEVSSGGAPGAVCPAVEGAQLELGGVCVPFACESGYSLSGGDDAVCVGGGDSGGFSMLAMLGVVVGGLVVAVAVALRCTVCSAAQEVEQPAETEENKEKDGKTPQAEAKQPEEEHPKVELPGVVRPDIEQPEVENPGAVEVEKPVVEQREGVRPTVHMKKTRVSGALSAQTT